MGKKTEPNKAAAPAKRAAKREPAAEIAAIPAPAPAAPAARKTPATPRAKAPAAKAAAKKAAPAKPKAPAYTHDDIALRAYFIAERRQKAGLPGDAHSDWVAAEQELAAEAKAAKRPKAKAS